MNDKHRQVLEELLPLVDEPYKDMFIQLAEYAVALGYNPFKNKTHAVSIEFRKNKTKRSILKLEQFEQKQDGGHYKERIIPGIRLRFFAVKEYSDIFKQGIKRVIEEFGGKYTGCYGCGRCDGAQGYTYQYDDGRKVFRCGSEFISIFNFDKETLPEIKALMKAQADYYEVQLMKGERY